MFGHHKQQGPPAAQEVEVDTTLELDLATVEQAIGSYLGQPTPDRRRSMVIELEKLDAQIDRSDTYENSIVDSAVFGITTKYSVVGETSSPPIADEVAGVELGAQMTLVKAAKDEARGPTPDTLAALRTAWAAPCALRPPTTDPRQGDPSTSTST
jgi:hypothetical protein